METNELYHYGVAYNENPPGRGSGRYPHGSGDNPNQHEMSFLSEVNKLKKRGYTESQIARTLLGQKGVNRKTGEPIWANSTDLRAEIAIQTTAERNLMRTKVLKLYDECHGNKSEVGRRLGIPESSVRSYLKDSLDARNARYQNTADFLKKRIDEVGVIDISSGSEYYMGDGVSDYTKKVAVAMLVKEGYVKTWVQYDQQFGQGNKTTTTVLARKPEEGETDKDVRRWVQQNKGSVKAVQDFSPDNGKTFWTPEFPEMLDASRIQIRYAEDGGKDKDGVIELRRGIEDISLGNSQYAQVRIGVNGTHYMKGMAMYGDDEEFAKLPKGVDIIYNTNKHRGVPLMDDSAYYDKTAHDWVGKEVLKRLKVDEGTMEVDRDNPFGALIKNPKEKDGLIMAGGQRHYVDENGNTKLSPINKLRDEGDWDSWSRTLSSQFLSKQPLKLIKEQLGLSIDDKKAEFDEIKMLTNPVVKQKMLDEFARKCDANAADLSAKGFKNQAFQVILPLPHLKEDEIYAPAFKGGDTVALVRYPHAGTFEIPILKVNNKDEKARSIMKDAFDAVGINAKVAERLSGADFDGDTVMVIPLKSNNLSITSTSRKLLPGLQDFEPKDLYPLPLGSPKMKDRTKQRLMGEVTNLITDMTVGGAGWPEIEKAVRHSMVVIDAQKHNLDYKQSAIDNDIDYLKKTYQGTNSKGKASGASTILSKAGSEARVDERKEITSTRRMTPEQIEAYNRGEKVYEYTGRTKMKQITNPKKMTPDELERYQAGKKVYRESNQKVQQKTTKMDLVSDAFDLVRDPTNPKEVAYANYANALKDLANQARKESRSIKPTPVNKAASQTYAKEVASLKEKLARAEMNSPRERQAQALAGTIVAEKFASNPNMDYEHRQRERARALTQARATMGAKKELVDITDREWDAIQSNAVSTNVLKKILNNTNEDKFKQRATPRNRTTLTNAERDLARSLSATGRYTNAEIAERLNVSVSTVINLLG